MVEITRLHPKNQTFYRAQ